MRKTPRILFTTSYTREKKPMDLMGLGVRKTSLRATFPRISSWGLRFIKQNLPQIEIMEWPTWEEYEEKLQEGWDVVGFSFFLIDTPEVLQMIERARKSGVKEIWGGNYGILTDGIGEYFDRTFLGYAEEELAETLNLDFNTLQHPPLVNYIGTCFGPKIYPIGMVFSSRGCNLKCDFCQGPVFCSSAHKVPLESVERVLRYYKKIGLGEVALADESFGLFKKHSKDVLDLLDKYGFYWTTLTRVDLLAHNLEEWLERGLRVAMVGIESINQGNLDSVRKRQKIEEIVKIVETLRKRNRFCIGYYIIGFEDDTEETVRADIEKLVKLRPDVCHVHILTPFPGTGQWKYLHEKYGLTEDDYRKFDGCYLIFNHPNFTADRIEGLLHWARSRLLPKWRLLELGSTYVKQYCELEGSFIRGMRYISKQFKRANTLDYSSHVTLPD